MTPHAWIRGLGPFGYARLLAVVLICVPFCLWDHYGQFVRLPGGYYILLRWIVCPVLAVTAYRAYGAKSIAWTWVFGIDAAIFNPLLPARLGKEVWGFVDFVTIALIAASFFLVFGRGTKSS